MRRLGLGVLIALLAVTTAAYGQNEGKDASPSDYQPSEFPDWVRELRRAEIVGFGALPFTVFFAITIVDSYRYATHGWNPAYAPWPLKSAGAIAMTEIEAVTAFSTGVIAAAAVAALDWLLVRLRENKKATLTKYQGSPLIETRPYPGSGEAENGENSDGSP